MVNCFSEETGERERLRGKIEKRKSRREGDQGGGGEGKGRLSGKKWEGEKKNNRRRGFEMKK